MKKANAVYLGTESGDEYVYLVYGDTPDEVVEEVRDLLGAEFAFVSGVMVDSDDFNRSQEIQTAIYNAVALTPSHFS